MPALPREAWQGGKPRLELDSMVDWVCCARWRKGGTSGRCHGEHYPQHYSSQYTQYTQCQGLPGSATMLCENS